MKPCAVVSILAAAAAAASALLLASGSLAATDKRVNGIITAVAPAEVCITTSQGNKSVTGRVDPRRTRVVVGGHAAHAADLHVTDTARAELGLDDVWLTIQASR